MVLVKNALRSITRSKGRNILIGIIVLLIAVSACVGLSIRQAAVSTRDQALADMTVTAQIAVDRSSMMQGFRGDRNQGGKFDPSSFKEMFQGTGGLSLEELQVYAGAKSVQSFTYTLTASLNGGEGLEAVDTSSSDSGDDGGSNQGSGGFPGGGKGFGGMEALTSQGDFSIIGYSGDDAMTDFVDGIRAITEGAMFTAGTESAECVISDELAAYNDLAVGDTLTFCNPQNEEETYTLTVVGIYHNEQASVQSGGMGGGMPLFSDPANQVLVSYPALKLIVDASAALQAQAEAAADTEDEGEEGEEAEIPAAVSGQVAGTYVFASVEDYEAFEGEARALGLPDTYAVSSADVTQFEQSLAPLENLGTIALYFLLVVLAIGAVVLVVINVFNIRDRKYEVGVLTAIGMRKSKVALQFLTETLTVTLAAVIIGTAAGAVISVPVTNALLASQISAQEESGQRRQDAFGRQPEGMEPPGGMFGGMEAMAQPGGFSGFGQGAANYISQVSSATDLAVLLELLAIGLGLALIASAVSVIFIMRYEPLKILANRD